MLHCVVVDHTNIPNFKEVSPVILCDTTFVYPNIEMMGYFNLKNLTLTDSSSRASNIWTMQK
jgi:hypothetical protein